MRTHALKTVPDVFQMVRDGVKRFEYRKNDRCFMVGDMLELKEWDPSPRNAPSLQYSGRQIDAKVTCIIHGGRFGIPEGYCIMGIRVQADLATAVAAHEECIVKQAELLSVAINMMKLIGPEREQNDPEWRNCCERLRELAGIHPAGC